MRHGSLFSGIGGFDLAAEWMGWENAFHCEWNEFGKRVLKYYWPKAISYDDITKTDFNIHRGTIDILSGGFPCQPYSQAGRRLGKDDDRHLWPEMLRAIREIQPTWVVGENVPGLVNWNGGMVFNEVQADLEAEGYEVTPFLLPACSVNAPHKRERIWFVASNTTGFNGRQKINMGNKNRGSVSERKSKDVFQQKKYFSNGFNNIPSKEGLTTDSECSNLENERNVKRRLGKKNKGQSTIGFKYGNIQTNWDSFPTTEPTILSRNDGISSRLVGITFPKFRNESIKAYGNAIVPQVVFQIFKAIDEFNEQQK